MFEKCRRAELVLVSALFIASLPQLVQAQSLEHLIGSALATHPSIQGQRALVQSSEAGLDSARWQFYPTPSVSVEAAGARAADPSYRGDSRVATARLQQPLWTGGRLTAGRDKAQAGLVANHAALEEVRLQLGLRVVQSYGDWLAAHLKRLASEKSLATHGRLREQVLRRLAEGTAAESDLTLAVSRLEAIRADITAAGTQGEVALARLSQLVGGSVEGATLAKTVTSPRSLNGNAQSLLDHALGISPTLAKVKAQAEVQAAMVDERRADFSPEVYARLERQYGNYNFPNAAPENRVFIGLSSRFGAGLSTLSNAEAARAQHAAALAEIEVQSRTVSEQVLADVALALSVASRMTTIEASLKAAADVSASYDRQFLAGRKSWLDVMNAARELAQIETQLAELQSTQVVVTWRLAAATRGIDAVTDRVK